MKKRFVSLILTLAVLIGTFSAFAIITSAESPIPELSIAYCNLSFRDSVCIKYAVDANVSDVKILIWTSPEAEYTLGTHDDEITEYYFENIGGVPHMIFDYTELTAKQMTDVVYARAYTRVNGVDYYSDVNKYSILQYAYNKLGKTAAATTDTELKEMLTHMLAYGAAAQKYLNDYKVDRLATADWYQVKVTSGKLDDGCTHGLYLPGDKVTMVAPVTDANGATFSHWEDSKGNKISTDASYELTVGNKNEVYTPVYVKYSLGLEFDSNGDGTCYVVGVGDCTDTELVIPPVSPENDVVIGIDNSAFAGEAITSVSFPNTLEEIGRRAFNGCASLTDVYYDGTEEEWNEINISSGNDVIENATKHFNEPAVETFTVTFVDYDGTVLKVETVENGCGATAPTDPVRTNYQFVGWDVDYSSITADITVTAEYVSLFPTISVENIQVSKETAEVTFDVCVKKNPGIMNMVLSMTIDDTVFGFKAAEKGNALPSSAFTTPGTQIVSSPYKFLLDAMEITNEDKEDGVIFTVTLSIDDLTAIGEYEIELTYIDGDIVDENFEPINMAIENGTIIIK